MRGWGRLIPEDLRSALSANPALRGMVAVVMVVAGVFLVVKGANGFRNKRLTGKRGHVFEGTWPRCWAWSITHCQY